MKNNNPGTIRDRTLTRRAGFVLLVTMVVLVMLATLTASLSVSLSMAKRRQQYMIEYQRARYGLDSAMKYILKEIPKKRFTYEDRQGKPDFSDVFWMTQTELGEHIADWSETVTDEELEDSLKEGTSMTEVQPKDAEGLLASLLASLGGGKDSDANTMPLNTLDPDGDYYMVELDPNDVKIPGPYGPAWPNVIEPIELEIGPCEITISIEDENAKMPLSWLVTTSKEVNKRAEDSLKTFCEWMAWEPEQLREMEGVIQEAMKEIGKEKKFTLNPSPIILKTTPTRTSRPTPTSRRTASTRRAVTRRTPTRTTTQKRPAVAHRTDFAKLFHSSLLDQEFLARPLPDTGERVETPLKYLSLWGAQRVNINTAPRHVLQAAFAIAMDSFEIPQLAQSVIERRMEEPFKKVDELKELGDLDSETMKGLANYLTTTSTFFKVRVSSRSGNAASTAVATVVKEGSKVQTLAILYEL